MMSTLTGLISVMDLPSGSTKLWENWTVMGGLQAPAWPDEDVAIGWAIWAHYILCLWIAIQAPRRLADDKQSGALELLLCTPLTPREIVRGSMGILRRQFGRGLAGLLA